jgi:C4-dicarboxylate transporter, DctM subunit
MNPIIVGVVGIVILFAILAFRVPIAFAMAAVGFVGFVILNSWKSAFSVVTTEPFAMVTSYTFSVLPVFVLMGQFAFHSGLGEKLFYTANKWLGQLPGGLAIATVGACAGFSAICGSTLATAATMGAVALPEMKKYSYDPALSTGCVACGGTLGILIPPSAIFIIYGVLTEQSITQLFIAGIIPGILLALLFMLTIYIQVKIKPSLGPPAKPTTMKEKVRSLAGGIETIILFLVVIGGLYGGIFTPNEAAAVGAVGALVLGLIGKGFTWKKLGLSLDETMRTTVMIITIIIGAMILNRFITLTTLPDKLSDFVGGLAIPPIAVMIVIFLIYAVLGCIMDSIGMLLLTVPIFYPLVISIGFDPIWYGVIMVIVMELAAITPPIGMNVYVIAGVAKDVPMYTIFRGIYPFIIPICVLTILLLIFPQIALFLPNTMK